MAQLLGFNTRPLRLAAVWAVGIGVYSCSTMLKQHAPFSNVPDIPIGLDATLSLAIALLIGFRINRAYERWWEARTLWGSLVNATRNAAAKIAALADVPDEDRQAAGRLLHDFATQLKDHLRQPREARQSNSRHEPLATAHACFALLAKWQHAGQLEPADAWRIDLELRELLNVCGGCERIRNTDVSRSWRHLTTQCIALYLLVFPWGLADDFGVWVVPLSVIAAYLVAAGEAIARQVEQPFGREIDQLDLDSICGAIGQSITQLAIETQG